MMNLSAILPEKAASVTDIPRMPGDFTEVYDQYFRQILNFVRYRVGDLHAAEDLTAVIFEKVLHGLPRYRAGAAPFSVWLFRIARNTVNDYYRREKRNRTVPLEHLPEWGTDEDGPAERVLEQETRAELNAAIRRLGGREQEILALKFAARFTNREIARTMGLSDSHVGVILYRTIQRLQTELKGGELHA